MRLRLALVAAAVIGGLSFTVGVGAQSTTDSVGRIEAIDLLEPLIDKFEVNLTVLQRREVASNCLQIQATSLGLIRDRLPAVRSKYETFLATAGGQLWGLTNHVSAFADDASNLNLAMVELRRFRVALDGQMAAYDHSLQTAVAINCIAYPKHFVAGLHQILANRRQLVATATALVEFVDIDLPMALVATECHLFSPEDDDCR